MSLKLEIPHEGQVVVFEIFPNKEIDVGDYDINYDILSESLGEDPTLPFMIANEYTNHGTSGLARSVEMIQVVGKAIEKDHLEHNGSGISEFVGINDPESEDEVGQPCSQEMTLLYIYHLFTVYERMVQHANTYHDGNIKESLTHHRSGRKNIHYKFVPEIMGFLRMWWDRTTSGAEKWTPPLETGVSNWNIRMLDVFDPMILWWDNVWSICEHPVDSVPYDCIGSTNAAAYVVSYKEQDVAIFWAWRADPIMDHRDAIAASNIKTSLTVRKHISKSGKVTFTRHRIKIPDKPTREPTNPGVSNASSSSQDQPGILMVIDGIHSMFSNSGDNKQLLNIIAEAATRALQNDPTIEDIRFGNYYGTDKGISRLLHSQKSWPMLGSNMFYDPGDRSENLYVLHPYMPEFLQDKSGHTIKIYQWLIARR